MKEKQESGMDFWVPGLNSWMNGGVTLRRQTERMTRSCVSITVRMKLKQKLDQ